MAEGAPYNPLDEDDEDYFSFIAIFFGMFLKGLVGNLNEVFTKMISTVIFFVPPIAFFAMITLVLEIRAETLAVISKLFIGQLIAGLLMFSFYQIFIWRVGKISFKPFVEKILALLPPALATSSSTVVTSSMMKLCTDKLGISQKFLRSPFRLVQPSTKQVL